MKTANEFALSCVMGDQGQLNAVTTCFIFHTTITVYRGYALTEPTIIYFTDVDTKLMMIQLKVKRNVPVLN
jgi:hypothetical protein